MSKCSANKKDGTPCSLSALGSSSYCWAHNPDNAEARKKVASTGGRGRAARFKGKADEIAEVQAKIRDLISDVLEGEVDKAKASVAFQGLGVLKGFYEQERKQREYDELEQRIEALERMKKNSTTGEERVRTWGSEIG